MGSPGFISSLSYRFIIHQTFHHRPVRAHRASAQRLVVTGPPSFAGCFPVVGNLVSNSNRGWHCIPLSPSRLALAAWFSSGDPQLEYFLNIKLVGSRSRTLLVTNAAP